MLLREGFAVFVTFGPVWLTGVVKMMRWHKTIFSQSLGFRKLLIISDIILCNIIVVFMVMVGF
jgi:hypothetical protein